MSTLPPATTIALKEWHLPALRAAGALSSRPAAPTVAQPRPMIAICHLHWDWVWQRPQQFLSRFAESRPVLFVETHGDGTREAYSVVREAGLTPGVTVIEVHLPAERWHDGDFIDRERRRVLQEALRGPLRGRFDDAVLWFNDPMAVTAYAGHLGEALVVYDCMDELTQFHGAPPQLCERELELTRRADVIFCGGRKMRDKRLPLNANTHFFGTGVDCRHFGAALQDEVAIDPEIARLPGPVLGYFGVVDERLDYELLAALADAFPTGSVAIVGPTAKVDPAALPQRRNLHWLGGRHYSRLPAITKGFTVCLMPFARNAATEYINPTKALEYMAAGRPVVSTDLDEVRTNFPAAGIAADHGQFIALCRAQAGQPSRERVEAGLRQAAANTWEALAARMDEHLVAALAVKARSASGAPRREPAHV
jgi:glycosyltransferase involved in cell wall biosynthesis